MRYYDNNVVRLKIKNIDRAEPTDYKVDTK